MTYLKVQSGFVFCKPLFMFGLNLRGKYTVGLQNCKWVNKINAVIFQSITDAKNLILSFQLTRASLRVFVSCYSQRNSQGNLKPLEKTMENVMQIFRWTNHDKKKNWIRLSGELKWNKNTEMRSPSFHFLVLFYVMWPWSYPLPKICFHWVF